MPTPPGIGYFPALGLPGGDRENGVFSNNFMTGREHQPFDSAHLIAQLETSNNRAIWMKEPGIRLWCGRLVRAIGMPTRGRLG